ncbi:uncharacterized protein BDZ99DRAFT_504573 [Mytilinidion resinicola]|uniref:RING-type domain-containing protein n=1 Tax=Mytilinidion resinicola TaxID=574789 RepID=A0A6A6XY07_9PEZI|nr:uncharacterized protein BDZ99DRAFT_504573 [Mytilinidion resinicola]KAF2801436.1 hypothetical protein BDZ99DRAFT_504573 [Mytilinidion resinicola]
MSNSSSNPQPLGVFFVRSPSGGLSDSNINPNVRLLRFWVPGRTHNRWEKFTIGTALIDGAWGIVVTFNELNVRMKIWEENDFRADACPPRTTRVQTGIPWTTGNEGPGIVFEEQIPGINPRDNWIDPAATANIQQARNLVRRPGADAVITTLYQLSSGYVIALVAGVDVITFPVDDIDNDHDSDDDSDGDVPITYVGPEISVDAVATPVPAGEVDLDVCGICREEYGAGHIAMRLWMCQHVFGRHCLHALLNHRTAPTFTCPTCRAPICDDRDRRGNPR